MVLGVVALVAAIVAMGGSIQGGDPRLQEDPQAVVDRDARTGRKAPSAQQRAAARGKTVRWNRFQDAAAADRRWRLPGDRPGQRPVAAAGPGRRRPCSASMVPPLRTWSCWRARRSARTPVLFQQRFGGLPAGHDACRGRRRRGQGRLRVVVTGWQRPRRRRELSPTEAFRRAAGLCRKERRCRPPARRGGRLDRLAGRSFASPQRIRLVALPIPGAGAVPAYEAIVLDGAAAEPLGVSVFVDARSGAVLLQESPGRRRGRAVLEGLHRRLPSTTPRPTRASFGAGRPGPAVTGSSASSPGPEWDVAPARGRPSRPRWEQRQVFTTGSAATRSRSGPRRPRRVPTATTSGWTNQWFQQRCNPARRSSRPSGTTSTPRGRPVRRAQPHATGPAISATEDLQACRRTTSASVGSGTTTSRATPRPAA